MTELVGYDENGNQIAKIVPSEEERLKKYVNGKASEHGEVTHEPIPEFVKPLKQFVYDAVEEHLKARSEGQNMALVEELYDKFNFICAFHNIPNPTATDIALWKAGELKPPKKE